MTNFLQQRTPKGRCGLKMLQWLQLEMLGSHVALSRHKRAPLCDYACSIIPMTHNGYMSLWYPAVSDHTIALISPGCILRVSEEWFKHNGWKVMCFTFTFQQQYRIFKAQSKYRKCDNWGCRDSQEGLHSSSRFSLFMTSSVDLITQQLAENSLRGLFNV